MYCAQNYDLIHHFLWCPSFSLHPLLLPCYFSHSPPPPPLPFLFLSFSLFLHFCLFIFAWFSLNWSVLTTAAASAYCQQVSVTGTASLRAKGIAAQPPSHNHNHHLSTLCCGSCTLNLPFTESSSAKDYWKIKVSNAKFLKTCYVR